MTPYWYQAEGGRAMSTISHPALDSLDAEADLHVGEPVEPEHDLDPDDFEEQD